MPYQEIYVNFIGVTGSGKGHKNFCYGVRGAILPVSGYNSGLPLFYPALFITTQLRNRSLSYSSMEATLSGISVLLRYMEGIGQKIEARFHKNEFFKEHELDAIRDFCQIKFRDKYSKSL